MDESTAGIDDWQRLDLRIGTVVEVQPFPRARNPSWKVAVDLGPLGIRWSSAQITNYSPEALVGTQVTCVCNLSPRNIAGFASELLILGGRDPSGAVMLLSPRSPVPNGARVE